MTVLDIPEAATPGIATKSPTCPHWWVGACDVRYPGVHECAGRLLHAGKHTCACGAGQSR